MPLHILKLSELLFEGNLVHNVSQHCQSILQRMYNSGLQITVTMIAPKTLQEKKIGNDCKYPENTDGSSVLTKENAYLKRNHGLFSLNKSILFNFFRAGAAFCS